ncbi:MAG: penicillin-insensitive murein endopeptidase [Rhodobacterales bacterium]|nr:penicillin-insensitive murein endopeptidase [Rhodobacterales bacterium]NCT13481.1 penicillin-insensitive murein endopeptidase [Rhodobacterales bacterium]
MVRKLATVALILVLAGCQTDRPASPARDGEGAVGRASISTQNANDSRIAKTLFGAMSFASAQPPEAIGGFSRGCQAGAVQLPESGPTWQAMRLSRNRNWAQPVTVQFVQDLSRFAATQPGWAGLYIGDMSQPRGGPMLTGHASHQTGLDADIWMLPPRRLDLSRQEREDLSSIRMDRSSGAYVNGDWSAQHMAILRAAASDPRVNRIFVFAGAKVAMCDAETGDRTWLNKIRPWYGHNYHFHVRLNCPAGARGCEPQAAIPPGDGCEDARQWVRDILNPPPPDPNAPPPRPRGELTMAALPGQCLNVLNSN